MTKLWGLFLGLGLLCMAGAVRASDYYWTCQGVDRPESVRFDMSVRDDFYVFSSVAIETEDYGTIPSGNYVLYQSRMLEYKTSVSEHITNVNGAWMVIGLDPDDGLTPREIYVITNLEEDPRVEVFREPLACILL